MLYRLSHTMTRLRGVWVRTVLVYTTTVCTFSEIRMCMAVTFWWLAGCRRFFLARIYTPTQAQP